jgi:hypothetical protein
LDSHTPVIPHLNLGLNLVINQPLDVGLLKIP